VDPNASEISAKNIEIIQTNAAKAVPELIERLLNQ
jgi:hypothetical protein